MACRKRGKPLGSNIGFLLECRDKTRKGKVHLKLNLSRVIKDKKNEDVTESQHNYSFKKEQEKGCRKV